MLVEVLRYRILVEPAHKDKDSLEEPAILELMVVAVAVVLDQAAIILSLA